MRILRVALNAIASGSLLGMRTAGLVPASSGARLPLASIMLSMALVLAGTGAGVVRADKHSLADAAYLKRIQQRMGRGVRVDSNGNGGDRNTMLLVAVDFDYPESVAYLLAHGANPGYGPHDMTPLMLAADWDEVRIARMLIKHGAPVNGTDRAGPRKPGDDQIGRGGSWTALQEACLAGAARVAALLIAERADVNTTCSDGITPVYIAVRFPVILKMLLHAHAKINSANIFGITPLDHAASLGMVDSVKLLLSAGVKVASGRTNAMFYAANAQTVAALFEAAPKSLKIRCHGRPPLAEAIRQWRWGAAQRMLKLGANVNQRDTRGRTALFYAAAANSLHATRMLLDDGARVNMMDFRRHTALQAALRAGTGRRRVAILLWRYLAKQATRSRDFSTAPRLPGSR